jgi:tetratricopeptide (TPR) repeat protein
MRAFFLAFVLSLSLSSNASAQSAAELERAKRSFKAGANAYATGDYLAAIQALELAYELTPLPAIAFSLAQAERKQYFVDSDRRHLDRAVSLFQRYLEQAPRGARREDATLALKQLEPLLGVAPGSAAASSAAKVNVRPTRLMIVAEAPGARISLDGGEPAASPLIREVPPGKHRARVAAPGFSEVEREVTALAGELILTEVRLPEKPSSVYVDAPAGAEIYVNGSFAGEGGERLRLQLPSGAHQLAVADKGRRVVQRALRLGRGEPLSVQVALEPTTQRRLSKVLFMVGGAALGSGLLLSAVAIRSENRAEDFLGAQGRGNVSEPARVSYNASLSDRDRYRAATVVSFAGAAGLFITGLFLHELDQPNAWELRRGPTPPDAASASTPKAVPTRLPDSASRTALLPLVTGQDFGASLRVGF